MLISDWSSDVCSSDLKFLKALKNSDIEALDFSTQLDEGVREGWITADERVQLEELRTLTLDTTMVDDFATHELRAASYYDLPQHKLVPREAACRAALRLLQARHPNVTALPTPSPTPSLSPPPAPP